LDRKTKSGVANLLPQTIIDSGNQASSRPADYYNTYKTMVDTALARTGMPQVDIQVEVRRVPSIFTGDDLEFTITVTNQSGMTLSGSTNSAMLHAIVYEDDNPYGLTDQYVIGSVYSFISPSLASGATRTFTLTTDGGLGDVDWGKIHSVVLADYRHGGDSGPCDLLRAVRILYPGLGEKIYLPLVVR